MKHLKKDLRLDSFRTLEEKTKSKLEFKISNETDRKKYEFVKLYLETNYIGLKYVDVSPGEVKKISFKVDNTALTSNPTVYLTRQDKEEGVLLKRPYDAFRRQKESSTDKKLAPDREKKQEMPERLEKEYKDLTKRKKEKKKSLLDSVVGSFKRKEVEEDHEELEIQDEDEQEEPEEDPMELLPSEKVDRITTGIINLDQHMQGGLVQGTMNLVTGKTGTGKTAFCASFLKGGAENRSPGVYVTTEEREEDIKADIRAMFGWEFDHLEEEGLVKILSIKPIFPSKEIQNLNRLVRSYISNLLDQVMHAVEDIDAERVIIDSVSIIEMFIRDEYMSRVALASLLNKLREANVTAVLTGTVPETSQGLSGGGIIEFLVDTVILLEFVPVAEDHQRTLTIRKMRRTDHSVNILPMEITSDGVKVFDI